MSNLVTTTEESIRRRGLLDDGQSILVAVSGGLDSTVLLRVLSKLSTRHRWTIIVAHFNHRLRGAAGKADELFVKRLSRKLGISFHRGEGDVREYARMNGLSIEMGARQLRHAFLAETARNLRIDRVVTAHHADDQVELLLLRLLRGGGLTGMKWINPSPADAAVQLVRPLLDQEKATLRSYAESEGISFREDASNRINDALRNRIRNQILPFLGKHQPAFWSNALRTMEIASAEGEFSKIAAGDWLARRRRKAFEQLHLAVQRQIIHLQLIALKINPTFDLIELLRTQSERVVATSLDRRVFRDLAGNLQIGGQSTDQFDSKQTTILLRGRAGQINFNGLKLRWKLFERTNEMARPSRSRFQSECFDAERVGESVTLRYWRPGDRFRPIGMRDQVKLQDFFTNQKIPAEQRRRLTIATTSDGEIFWVEGLRIGEDFKLDARTTRILRWVWDR